MLIADRNEKIDICKIVNELAIDEESISVFFDNLEKEGIITFCNNLGELLVNVQNRCCNTKPDYSKNMQKKQRMLNVIIKNVQNLKSSLY